MEAQYKGFNEQLNAPHRTPVQHWRHVGLHVTYIAAEENHYLRPALNGSSEAKNVESGGNVGRCKCFEVVGLPSALISDSVNCQEAI